MYHGFTSAITSQVVLYPLEVKLMLNSFLFAGKGLLLVLTFYVKIAKKPHCYQHCSGNSYSPDVTQLEITTFFLYH